MKKKIAIYLAGNIKKGHEKIDELYWTSDEKLSIERYLEKFEILFLNPAFRTDDLSDAYSVLGRDMLQVFSSDIVLVDARDRRVLGVGAEMMWAKVNHIPVITWAPKNSYYHKEEAIILDISISNYIHPFVESLSDKIVEDLIEASYWIEQVITNQLMVKDIKTIGDAMKHYKEGELFCDVPMRELLTSHDELHKRMYRSHPKIVFS